MSAAFLSLLTIGATQLLAVISPGPSFLLTARAAVARSRAEGLKVAVGLGAGTLVWALAALLGLKLLFQQHYWVFVCAKALGALFLLWIAYKIFRQAARPMDMTAGPEQSGSSLVQGFMTQISNPKVAVFFGSVFVALLPQEVPLWMACALLLIVVANEVLWYSCVALFFAAGPVRKGYLAAKKWIDRTTGVFLGALGLRLLWSARDAV